MHKKCLYIIFMGFIILSLKLSATTLSGPLISLEKDQVRMLEKIACTDLAGGTLNEISAWKFSESSSNSIEAKISCDVNEVIGSYQERKIYKCNNFNGGWQCNIFSSEIKRVYPELTGIIYINPSPDNTSESLEVIDNLVRNVSLNKI